MMRHLITCALAVLLTTLVVACTSTPTPEPTATPLPPTPTSSPTATATAIPTPTPTPTPTPIPVPALVPTEKYQKPGNYLDNVTVDGLPRFFTVRIPTGYQPGNPAPLVINIHGRTSTTFQQEALSQMNAKADKGGFVVVGPQALGDPSTWWGPLPNELGQPDMDFFEELLAYLQREISIDPDRIYATGLSNGATMANRLACDMADTFAAIAPVAGGHVAPDECEPLRPVSVLVIHGTDDPIIPYHGNERDTPPVHSWVQAWGERNGCDGEPSPSRPYPDVLQETWENCAEGAEVTLLSLEGGGHTWPGAPLSVGMGSTSQHINATDVIWDFFVSHPINASR
ncbi:alpha/beta hydrolase family esterase [Chloroflexota bacterium]